MFLVMVAKKKKNASSITRILQIGTTTVKAELTGLVLSEEKKLQPQKPNILRKRAQILKSIYTN